MLGCEDLALPRRYETAHELRHGWYFPGWSGVVLQQTFIIALWAMLATPTTTTGLLHPIMSTTPVRARSVADRKRAKLGAPGQRQVGRPTGGKRALVGATPAASMVAPTVVPSCIHRDTRCWVLPQFAVTPDCWAQFKEL